MTEKDEEQQRQQQEDDDPSSFLPDWISGSEIDPNWIQKKAGLSNVKRCTAIDISNDTRKGDTIRNGATLRILVAFNSSDENPPSPLSLVIKQVPDAGRPQSRRLGLAREALFYDRLAPRIDEAVVAAAAADGDAGVGETSTGTAPRSIIPKIYHANGNMDTGAKIVIMEDLCTTAGNTTDDAPFFLDSGILFGPGNPNNWNRNLKERINQAYGDDRTPPTGFEVANETFRHNNSWLRGSRWAQGRDKESWQASQGFIQMIWNKLSQDDSLDQRIEWDPLVKSTVQKAIEGISWEAQLQRLDTASETCHWTLVHGDFWPGNILLSTKRTSDLRLVDWEMTGLGSGPQDLGQYVLSNMDPRERRACEGELIRNYYHQLKNTAGAVGGVEIAMTWEECWREYKVGGVERWLWFLVFFLGQEGPLLEWGQFFHNQIASFLHDHNMGPDSVVQPRP